jgi:hypothetical protein
MTVFANQLTGEFIDLRNCYDGEVLGLDTDGCVIQFNAGDGEAFNCGESLEDWGRHNLQPHEMSRVGLAIAAAEACHG